MRILYIGDVMGEVGIEVVKAVLPKLKLKYKLDLVIAQAENVSQGKGITVADYKLLKSIGIDFFTGGNWTNYREEILPLLNDPNEPIIRPANYPTGDYKPGYKLLKKNNFTVLVISLLGHTVGKDSLLEADNPLQAIDTILKDTKNISRSATIVNFHGDYSSEKVIIGHYLDGRVTAVVGDHWHVPTADARILPKSTAHISDVGMCGVLNASLGVKLDSVLPRWLKNIPTRNMLETEGPRQFNAVLIETNNKGLAKSIKQIQETLN